jgi:hypothetical protein
MAKNHLMRSLSINLVLGYVGLFIALIAFVILFPTVTQRILNLQEVPQKVVQQVDASNVTTLYTDQESAEDSSESVLRFGFCVLLIEKPESVYIANVTTISESGADSIRYKATEVFLIGESDEDLYCTAFDWVVVDESAWQNDIYIRTNEFLPTYKSYTLCIAEGEVQHNCITNVCEDVRGCNYLHARWDRTQNGTINFFTP